MHALAPAVPIIAYQAALHAASIAPLEPNILDVAPVWSGHPVGFALLTAGKSLALPITVETADIVDAVPVGGGMLNGNTKIGFDTRKRAVISYHKFDASGNTQIYNARIEGSKWVNHLASDWHYGWKFSSGGSTVDEIGLSGVRPDGKGHLAQTYWHAKLGSGGWLLDPETLRPIGAMPPAPPANRDRAREGTPPPTMLRVIRLDASPSSRCLHLITIWSPHPICRID